MQRTQAARLVRIAQAACHVPCVSVAASSQQRAFEGTRWLAGALALSAGSALAYCQEDARTPLDLELSDLKSKSFALGLATGGVTQAAGLEPIEDEVINWSSTHAVDTRIHQAESVQQVEALIRKHHQEGKKVRIVGSAISPNGLGLRYYAAYIVCRRLN